jgi:SAM-dependent methyltransferase
MQSTCPVCVKTNCSSIRNYRYHHPVFEGCSIVVCNSCGMVFADPMPPESRLEEYNAGYFENAHGGISTHPLTIAFHSAINLLRVLYVEEYAKQHNISIKNVLEIGPGGGYFAKHWLSRNKTASYIGVESDQSCHEKLIQQGIRVHSSFSSLPEESNTDLVVISHVLEHTSDPVGFLQNCTLKLLPGGILFIEVPCRDFEHKPLDEPHLLFFDKQPMKMLLEKIGFAHIQASYHGNTINELKKPKKSFEKLIDKLKNRLLSMKLVSPFSGKERGLEKMENALERAVIKPYKAHIEQQQPAWWLRAIAIKK